MRDVLEWDREATVDPERLQARHRRRGHAEAAVIVDVAGIQADAGELAEQIGLLVGEPAAAEQADCVTRSTAAIRSRASSQEAGRSASPFLSRTSGLVRRSGDPSSVAAV